jgi:hypothetical protein
VGGRLEDNGVHKRRKTAVVARGAPCRPSGDNADVEFVRDPATRSEAPPMSRRPFVLLALSLVALTLSACSDTTAPTSERQIKPSSAANADACRGGSLDSSGRC